MMTVPSLSIAILLPPFVVCDIAFKLMCQLHRIGKGGQTRLDVIQLKQNFLSFNV